MELPKIFVTEEVNKLLNNMVNMDRRSIIITGGMRTGKTLMLNYLNSISKHNTTLVDMWNNNIDIITPDLIINDSIRALANEKVTYMVDEVNCGKYANEVLIGRYTNIYENYIMAVHCGLNYDLEEVMKRLSRAVPLEFIKHIKPVIVCMNCNKYNKNDTNEYNMSIVDIYNNISLDGNIRIENNREEQRHG